jgi:hypothetical protein
MLNISEQVISSYLTNSSLNTANSINSNLYLYNTLVKSCHNNNLVASNQLNNNLSSMSSSSCLSNSINNDIKDNSLDLFNCKKSKSSLSSKSALINKSNCFEI